MHLTNDEANYILSQKISKAKFFLENDHRIQDKNEHAKKIKQLFDDWLNYNKEGGNEDESVG